MLPAGTDPSLANSALSGASLANNNGATAKWGTGGAYTKGGVSQSGGSDIGSTDDTLIAVPGQQGESGNKEQVAGAVVWGRRLLPVC